MSGNSCSINRKCGDITATPDISTTKDPRKQKAIQFRGSVQHRQGGERQSMKGVLRTSTCSTQKVSEREESQ